MALDHTDIRRFLAGLHPYDALPPDRLDALVPDLTEVTLTAGEPVYGLGDPLPGLFILHDGAVEVQDETGNTVSLLGPQNSFGERGLLRGGLAVTRAVATKDSLLLLVPRARFAALLKAEPAFQTFFDRRRKAAEPTGRDLATSQVDSFMARTPRTCALDTPVREAAALMRDHRVSSLCVTVADRLAGIVTVRDMSGKIVAGGLPGDTPVAEIMTVDPLTLGPSSIGSDVLHTMMEHRIGHIPIVEAGKLVGIVTQTDLTRLQAISSAELVSAIASSANARDMAKATAEIPSLLVQLVAAGTRHDVVTRLITDIADTATRRLLALAEARFGPPPVPYLWLACGSQGRQEQTGISDQDNCLFLHDDVTDADMAYFGDLARFVCAGLDEAGYVYCPGDMMATNPRWCQPVRVWHSYFDTWIAKPDPEAQMLASVMFDLRPIGGDTALFADLQDKTLAAASANSIFVAHMISNSLKHMPPLGLLRGLATIRSGEHRNSIDLKHNGVVPVVDLGRIYALRGKLTEVNTRARLEAAERAGGLSPSGARDLIDAYDLIAETRLEHQAAKVKRGARPDNFLVPTELSDFERSHLRDAFVVVKSLQSAAGRLTGALG